MATAASYSASTSLLGALPTEAAITAAIRPAKKPGMISYTPVPDRNASHATSTTAPTTMPATAPPNVNRRQNSESMITGPNAAPNTPQAFSTRPMMVPLPGSAAISSAITEMTTTTMRPAHSISLSLAFLRNTGLYTSLANAEAEASSCESQVLIAAARMAESSMPLTTAGNIVRTIVMNTTEESDISPRNMRPIRPEATEKIRIMNVQLMPITLDLRRSLFERMDMNLIMMCGMPK